ncbi:transcriptional regulator [Sulfuriferula multivorans]|uniref:Transcriptional regulator n=1 Tax=Sulfuriferula multivorans TaxID=1559896 RepID=A0A401JGM7_9PROT|nr:FMN-binding negative transcriptional regulator [Sulfuriferula multivorans]GBL46791.1 transcriptional regulator [Sulfuriferula multivorans]
MYIPSQFKEENLERLTALIEDYSFGTLVSTHEGLPFVSHLPFLFEQDASPHGKLIGHMARANPQWQHLAQGQMALAVFQGPHAYVSSGWYAKPGVPTWNYAVVHLYGRARIVEEESQLEEILDKLTAVHDADYPETMQTGYMRENKTRLLDMIVGFEIEVTEIQGKFKLSQNRSNDDQQSVIQHLQASAIASDKETAALMVSNLKARR